MLTAPLLACLLTCATSHSLDAFVCVCVRVGVQTMKGVRRPHLFDFFCCYPTDILIDSNLVLPSVLFVFVSFVQSNGAATQ